MNASSSNEVINIPLHWKEENHQSIERIGFHVFLSRFFFGFKSLPEEVQQGIVAHLLYNSEGFTPDKDSVNSLDTEV